MSEVPIRSVRVPAVLVGAAILGIGIGTWLGRVGSAAPAPSSAFASPGPSAVIDTPTATPSLAPPTSTTPAASPSPSPPGLILRQEGTSDATTATFAVEPGWQITWRTDGESFAYAVTGDQNLGTIVDKKGPASGVTSLSLGGSFRIEIKAVGPWSIVVVNGEEPNPSPS
jgi:hypothetical protein